MSRNEQTFQIKVKGRNQVVAQRCVFAQNIRSRMIGLLNHSDLPRGEAMMITSCNQVHTLFMRFAIDAVFLNADYIVLAVKELPPWKISSIVWKSKNVLELPLGVARESGLKVGDQLEVLSC